MGPNIDPRGIKSIIKTTMAFKTGYRPRRPDIWGAILGPKWDPQSVLSRLWAIRETCFTFLPLEKARNRFWEPFLKQIYGYVGTQINPNMYHILKTPVIKKT